MAIQLPDVKRIEPDQPQSVGRIQATAPNPERDMQSDQVGIDNVAQQAIKYRNEIANQEADTIAQDQTNNFETWVNKKRNGDPEDPSSVGLKFQKGDPVEIYKQFDKDAQAKLEELSKGEDWSQETQNLVNRRLSRKAEQLRNETLTDFGSQRNTFRNETTEASVKIANDAMPEASAKIDPESIAAGDMSTLDPIRSKISDVINLRTQQAIDIGGAHLDKNGTDVYTDAGGQEHRVTLGPVTKQKIAEELSKGLHDTTDNLIKTGSNDPAILAKAKVMMDQFNHYIEPLKKGSLQAEYDKSQVKVQANQALSDGEHLSPTEFVKSLDGKSEEVKTEALRLKSDQGKFIESMSKQKEEQNYRVGYNTASAILRDNPATTWSMAQQNSKIQNVYDGMNPTQRHAMEAMFNPPKVSDQFAIANMQQFISGKDPNYPDITKAPPEYIQELKSKLNPGDRKTIDSTLTKIIDPSNGSLLAQHQDLMRIAQNKAIALGLVTVDASQGGKVMPGTEAFKRLGDIQSKLTDAMKNTGALSASQRDEEVGKFMHTLVKGDPTYGTDYAAPAKLQGWGPAFGTTKPPTTGATKTDKQIRTAAIGLWQQNPANRGVPSEPVLKAFIEAHPEVKK